MQHVRVERRFPVDRQTVWDVYTDHVSWTDWAGIGRVRLDPPGIEEPNGVGCVRVISAGGISAFEEILSFEAPKRMTYRVVRGGLPMKDHLGEVDFEQDGDGTRVVWQCRFGSKIPGLAPLWGLIARTVFRKTLSGLGRELERRRSR